MAIRSKEIGWGEKENLLYEISKQLEKWSCALCQLQTISTSTTTTTSLAPVTSTTTTSTTSIPITSTTTTTIAPIPLELVWDDITNCPFALTVGDANTFFDLLVNGTPFTSLSVVGNTTRLYGGANINLFDGLFDSPDNDGGVHLLSFIDNSGCITSVGYDAFGDDQNNGCYFLTTVKLINTTSIGNLAFKDCVKLTLITLNSITSLGTNIFLNIIGNTITLTIPAVMASDPNVIYLTTNNTVTLILV